MANGAQPERSLLKGPLNVVAIYTAVSTVWILVSDHLVAVFIPQRALATTVQILKGWVFVAVTAALIYVLVSRVTRRYRQTLNALTESEKQFRTLVDSSPVAIVALDTNKLVTIWNAAAEEMFGWKEAEVLGKRNPAAPPDAVRLGDSIMRGESVRSVEAVRTRKDGSEIDVSISGGPLVDASGVTRGLVGLYADISSRRCTEEARHRAEASVRESEERFRSAFTASPLGVALIDLKGNWLQCNERISHYTGYTLAELWQIPFTGLLHPADRQTILRDARLIRTGGASHCELEVRYYHKAGHEKWALLSFSLVRSSEDRPQYFVAQFLDITVRKNLEKQLRYTANHDYLTGLYNRRRFGDELERLIGNPTVRDSGGALLFLDLDQFKEVNDSLGHRAGDELLVQVAERLLGYLKAGCLLARLGGDEFALFLQGQGEKEAQTSAQELLVLVSQTPFRVGGQTIRITTSVGIALLPDHGVTLEELLARADLAMYRGKSAGGNTAVFYQPDRHWQTQITSKRAWELRIREALETEQFVLFAQPIRDLGTGMTSKHEVLLRMRDTDGSLILPNTFLEVAERTGLIHEIDRWVVRRSIQLIAEAGNEGQELSLEVNLSGKAFSDPELLPMIQRELSLTGIDPARLTFEITETAVIADILEARQFLETLRKIGCRFALDDFGNGYLSFAHVRNLPVDYLKIDGAFVRNLCNDTTDRLLVEAMVRIARGLGVRTIAEFVEAPELVPLLVQLGIDCAQGYHIGRPFPATELLEAKKEDPAAL